MKFSLTQMKLIQRDIIAMIILRNDDIKKDQHKHESKKEWLQWLLETP